jgi:transposase-like protein
MNQKPSTTRRDYWQKLIDEQARSGQSVSVFCRQRGVSDPSFYTWRKRLSNETPMKFALVEPTSAARATSGVELAFATGERLHIARGADTSTLRMVLSLLREP